MRISSTSGRWDAFCSQIAAFLAADVVTLDVDGRSVRGFRSPDSPALWIRDHSDILRAGRYFEADVRSAVDVFADHQARSGRLFDYVTTDAGTEPENWEKWVRVPVEADVEYRFVKAAFLAWQATGDNAWAREVVPAAEAALRYTTTHPRRWSAEHGLVKRAYTVDTWDFDYTAGRHPWLNFRITDDTFWGITHADNSGLYEAMRLLARLLTHLGEPDRAARWEAEAAGLRERANALLFNGRFYTHFHKLTPVVIEGVDEAAQLSLSNPMAVNRGLATPAIAEAVVDEYARRRRSGGAFAEWFSIDPPFPDGCFGDDKIVAGAYCNGGIMPLVGGELARAALTHGREAYGVATLDQYRRMIAETGETYLWYFPDGTPSSVGTSTSPDAQPTDGWGASAMLYAFVEGLCGIVDQGACFRRVALAPRWEAAGEDEAEVRLAYPASGAAFGYHYAHDRAARRLRLGVEADADVALRLMLPAGCRPEKVRWDGVAVDHRWVQVGEGSYVEAAGHVEGETTIEVTYGET